MTIDSPTSSHPEADARMSAGAPAAPLRVAVVGLGERGIAHAAVLATLDRATLVGFADPDSAARRNLAGAGFHVPTFARLERLLARQKPDAVFVCSPLATRAALARTALAAGAAVFVERPIALAFRESARVVDEALRAARPLLCSHALMHMPVFARAHEAVRAGAIGAVREVRASVYVSRVFSAESAERLTGARGGGMIAYAAFDLLALLVRTIGLPLEAIATTNRLYGANEDELHAKLKLPRGGTLGLDCSWSVPGHPRPATVIEIEGDRGHILVSDDAIEIDGTAGDHVRLSDADLPQPARFDMDGEPRWIEDRAFVEWVLGGAEPPGANLRALEPHAVMHALEASAHSGGTPTPMPEGLGS